LSTAQELHLHTHFTKGAYGKPLMNRTCVEAPRKAMCKPPALENNHLGGWLAEYSL